MKEMILGAGASLALLVGCSVVTSDAGDRESTGAIATTRKALTSCISVNASGDAMVSTSPMNGNFGAEPIMRAGGKDESLIRFDLSAIPSSAVVESAALSLYVAGSGSDAPVNVHRVASAWTDSTVTYASFGQRFDETVLGSIVVTSPNVRKSVDLTPLVRSWIGGARSNFGVLLEANSTNKKTVFVSLEGGTVKQKPTLQVCYEVPEDHCSPNPCQNGASCENDTSGFECHCAPGYRGLTCEASIEECADKPCLNGGACSEGVAGYVCACAPGFVGTNCEVNLDDCAPSPCQNGGVCEDGIANYTCHCPPGYGGANCEALIDSCASQPCQNGAACTSGVAAYSCMCQAGFTGTSCETDIDDCAARPCHNGGTCIDGVAAYACSCPPDWGGDTCDVDLNTCSQAPCLNGSTCTNGFGTYTCACAAGYSGANCEIDVDDCVAQPCANGGFCVDGVDGYLRASGGGG